MDRHPDSRRAGRPDQPGPAAHNPRRGVLDRRVPCACPPQAAAAFGSDDVRWWEDETKLGDWWEDRKILYHVGDNKQPCGYWPAKHTNDVGITTSRPITGKWGDDDPWPYLSAAEEPSILYLAIYPDRDTVLESGRLFYKQPEDAI